jgi:hypothetical protein
VLKVTWADQEDPKSEEFKEYKRIKAKFLAKDKQGQLVFFCRFPVLPANHPTKIPFD